MAAVKEGLRRGETVCRGVGGRWRHTRFVLLLCVFAIGMATFGSGAAESGTTSRASTPRYKPPETKTLSVPIPITSGAAGAEYFAYTGGYFRKYGLTVTEPLGSVPEDVSLVVSGGDPIDEVPADDALYLAAKGQVQILGCETTTSTWYLYGKKGVSTTKQVTGGTVGVTGIGSGPQRTLIEYFQHNKLNYSGTHWSVIGSEDDILLALESGKIDAGVLPAPLNVQARVAKLPLLAVIGGNTYPSMGIPYVANAKWAASNQNTILNFLRAISEGYWVYEQQRSKALPALARLLHLDTTTSLGKSELKAAYNEFANIPPSKCPNNVVQSAIATLTPSQAAAVDSVPRAKLFDYSYINTLQKEGFFRMLRDKYGPFPYAREEGTK